ncbi:FMN-linked oxidoreductase [Fistulina hepatica ATCC 64428]|uniref:FMN-linked oxidoreductase n=1 Tax=Fistulina hepatica ATCC 64428 TaxID=1128425 RepID=A0A0D7APB1_9AGAR|nr:FMN-linked oxidoreductase [Fistulina hepatica ATCC 64428]
MSSTPALFQLTKVGRLTLGHRVVMAPLTRFRASASNAPLPNTIVHYAQRASTPGTLIITGGTFPHPKVSGLPHAPGIFTAEQKVAWKKVVDAVHAKGSYIFLQMAGAGRAASPSYLRSLPDGPFPFAAPSPIPLKSPKELDVPRELTTEEIKEIIGMFASASHAAVHEVGFDGVELHSANGFLLDQFLQENSNHRTDKYGGSVENRARFNLELLDAVSKVIGQDRIAIRLSPWSESQDMRMQDPIPQFSYLVREIKTRFPRLGYIHVIEPHIAGDGSFKVNYVAGMSHDFIRKIWDPKEHTLISCGGYGRESAIARAEETGELIAMGRHFISNPDLPIRFEHNIPLSPYDRGTFYVMGDSSPRGYTDYPFA